MSLNIHNETRYDEDAYQSLVYVLMRKVRRKPRVLLVTLAILILFTGSALFFLRSDSLLLSILLLMLGSVLLIFSVFAERFVTKMLLANQKKGEDLFYLYHFTDEEFTVENPIESKAYTYDSIVKVFSTERYMIFFLTDNTTYILRTIDMQPYDLMNLKAHIEALSTLHS